MRLVRLGAPAPRRSVLRPGAFELGPVPVGVVALQPDAILLDAAGDHRFARLLEDRPPLLVVRLQQPVAAPALQRGRQFPAQVDGVLEAGVQSEPTVGRVLVARVAGDEHAPLAVLAGDHDAQIPEANVVELGMKVEAGRLVQQGEEVEVVGGGVLGHRRVEEEALADVDAAEELPVALELRLHAPGRSSPAGSD